MRLDFIYSTYIGHYFKNFRGEGTLFSASIKTIVDNTDRAMFFVENFPPYDTLQVIFFTFAIFLSLYIWIPKIRNVIAEQLFEHLYLRFNKPFTFQDIVNLAQESELFNILNNQYYLEEQQLMRKWESNKNSLGNLLLGHNAPLGVSRTNKDEVKIIIKEKVNQKIIDIVTEAIQKGNVKEIHYPHLGYFYPKKIFQTWLKHKIFEIKNPL